MKTRVLGVAVAAVAGTFALAPAASAATTAAADTGSTCATTLTSPLTLDCSNATSSARTATTTQTSSVTPDAKAATTHPASVKIVAPPGVVMVGKPVTVTLTGLKPGTMVRFVVHGLQTKRVKVGKSGSVTFTYIPKAAGSYNLSASGTMGTGKGFGRTYTTKVKQSGANADFGASVIVPAAAGADTVVVAGHKVAASAVAGSAAAIAAAKAAAESALPASHGMAISPSEDVALGLVGLLLAGGSVTVARVGRKRAGARTSA